MKLSDFNRAVADLPEEQDGAAAWFVSPGFDLRQPFLGYPVVVGLPPGCNESPCYFGAVGRTLIPVRERTCE